MKPKRPLLNMLTAMLLLVTAAGVKGQTDERPKIIALERRRYDAMIRHDTTLLSGLLGDSLIFIHSSGVVDNKSSFLKDIGSGHITYIFIYPEKVTASVDGNYAWIYGRANIRFKLTTMTTTIDQYVSFVELYHLNRYQWQMVLCHNARIEKDAPYINNFIPQVKSGSVPAIY